MNDQSSDAVAAAPAWRAVATKILSAAAAIGVIGLVVAWGYSLGVSDPAAVPALAVDGDWRHRPEETGGRVVPGQEIAAYAEFGPVREVAGRTNPAPAQERPREEDVAAARRRAAELAAAARGEGGAVVEGVRRIAETPASASRGVVIDLELQTPQPERAPRTATENRTPPAETSQGAPQAAETSARTNSTAAVTTTSTEQSSTEQTPPQGAQGGAATPPQSAAEVASAAEGTGGEAAATVETAAAIETGPAPRRRPPSAASSTPPADSNPPATTVDAGPAPSPGGRYRAQLAALPSPAAVRARWAELQSQSPQLLGGYRLEIVDVDVNGGRLYRLRVGDFERRSDAAALCARLAPIGVDCFPTGG